jgi:hypothetical protein
MFHRSIFWQMHRSAAACGGVAGAMHATSPTQKYFPIRWANSRFFARRRSTNPTMLNRKD